ncbi:MAG: hydrolase or acyltransferase (alpha/beta hydrolase superfamily)-like protein [Frankiales bacterium]|jgi:pimeloyl-ACP methyl ester carboxylesterase|nr:hydrolase or acyltransferase (alpha/beta hydrolase superfamily)-like protein [Frankiales bacterium]
MTAKKRAGAVGAVAGVLAVGAAAGLAAERYAVGRARLRPDPEAREPFFSLAADRVRQVVCDDGVRLHVEEVGPDRADGPTVVFAHGYTQELAVWHYQRQAFSADNPGKLVFYDQRSHGRSGRSTPDRSTIDQLGRDLLAVLDACAPDGPVVLVGHSMGGMTIMALADQHPELFGTRITGVALLSTSTGKLAQAAFGLPSAVVPVTSRVLPLLTRGMRRRPQVFERGRRLGTDLAFLLSRSWAFGAKDVSPALVEFVEKMTASTPVDVIAEFYETFVDHDKLEALRVLDAVPTLVLCGTKDKLTPIEHSRVMAEAVPTAQLVEVEGAGHMVQLERAPLVTLHLRALLRRAESSVARTA